MAGPLKVLLCRVIRVDNRLTGIASSLEPLGSHRGTNFAQIAHQLIASRLNSHPPAARPARVNPVYSLARHVPAYSAIPAQALMTFLLASDTSAQTSLFTSI